jgi:hypothetical protein
MCGIRLDGIMGLKQLPASIDRSGIVRRLNVLTVENITGMIQKVTAIARHRVTRLCIKKL